MKRIEKKPLKPTVTMEQMLAYRHNDPSTHTSSYIINSIMEGIERYKFLRCTDVADYLDLDIKTLGCIMKVITGLSLHEVIKQWYLIKMKECIQEHPDWKLDTVAQHIGYKNGSCLWRFTQRAEGKTPRGIKSNAGPEEWIEMRKRIQARWGLK